MRIYLAVIVTLLVVLGFGLFSVNFLAKDAREIVSALDGLDHAMANDNWGEAQKDINRARKIWLKHKDRWAMVIDHQEIDNIDMALARVVRYIGLENRVLASGELAVLRHMLEHIPEKERVCLPNIF